jgi:hypothetical protein
MQSGGDFMSNAVKRDIWNAWDRSVGAMSYDPAMEEPARENTSEFLGTPCGSEGEAKQKVPSTVARELRRRKRSKISSRAQIVQWNRVQVNPEIVQILDASSAGILFATEGEYRTGEELLVRFPFPSATAPKQKGTVVRVEELPDGRRRVAARLE